MEKNITVKLTEKEARKFYETFSKEELIDMLIERDTQDVNFYDGLYCRYCLGCVNCPFKHCGTYNEPIIFSTTSSEIPSFTTTTATNINEVKK